MVAWRGTIVSREDRLAVAIRNPEIRAMRVLLQRVRRAAVRVDGRTVGSIDAGLLALVGVEREDTAEDATYLADKTAELRVFPDDEGRMNRSVLETHGSVLVVSQFTLAASTRRGRRPSFIAAEDPERAAPLCERFAARLRERGLRVADGVFRAHMEVELVNDGPVTILLDPPPWREAK
jgi:D-aminoacyl-tRNA deacylase